MNIYCISGKAQHGKDTTAGILKSMLESNGRRVLIVHFADAVKFVCRTFFGWNGEKDEHGRWILQYVGTDMVRAADEDFWVNFLSRILSIFRYTWDDVIIPDARFPNELSGMRRGGAQVYHIRVVRDGFDNGLTDQAAHHSSETALDKVEPDFLIHNNGTLGDLTEQISTVTRQIHGQHINQAEEN